jgi:Arc/MetJ-type ribon-helix-helix transcriptional regulator
VHSYPSKEGVFMQTGKTVNVETQIPSQLFEQADQLVATGWYSSVDEVISDALRRLLESRRQEVAEQFLRADVAWGLYGKE